MTDAEFELQKNRIEPLLKKWCHVLGLGWWRIKAVYEREQDAAPATGTQYHTGKWGRAMSTNVDWRYASGVITAYLLQTALIDDDELERCIVHECCHIFLNETRTSDKEDWLDHEERVATILSRAFIWLRDAVKEDTVAKMPSHPEE